MKKASLVGRFFYDSFGCCFNLPNSNKTKITAKNTVISSKKPKLASNSRNKPPRNGPVKLPILKNMPHNKFPVGNNSFGVKSDIYEMPSEKMDPTNKPAIKNIAITASVDVSTKLAMKNETVPPANAMSRTGRRPILSDNSPSGNCATIPPIENAANVIDRC